MQVPASLWATIIAIIAGVSWVFGASVATIYAAVVYLFVVHPFDVGDMLVLGPAATAQIVLVLAHPATCLPNPPIFPSFDFLSCSLTSTTPSHL